MFTGIIQDIGVVQRIVQRNGMTRLSIASSLPLERIQPGSSICVSGCCLTIIHVENRVFDVEAVPETLRLTTLGALREGSRVNLEPELRLSDGLGGSIVAGHVDGVATVAHLQNENEDCILSLTVSSELLLFVAYKGSITIDGVNLTVVHVDDTQHSLSVALIPYTLERTTLGSVQIGDHLNLEVDTIARYTQRLLSVTKHA